MAKRSRPAAFIDDPLWYKDAVIYQLHIKSFFDSNNDGIGDFAGLISKLDYIAELGVNTLWLLPFYPSPRRDDGYDIAEYKALQAVFGDRVHGIPLSATKAAHGHLLGGTGALEAIFAILAVKERLAPPTINIANLDPEIDLSVGGEAQALGDGAQLAISNSFGFGGHNAVVAIRSV